MDLTLSTETNIFDIFAIRNVLIFFDRMIVCVPFEDSFGFFAHYPRGVTCRMRFQLCLQLYMYRFTTVHVQVRTIVNDINVHTVVRNIWSPSIQISQNL